jgi:hypothetical protein
VENDRREKRESKANVKDDDLMKRKRNLLVLMDAGIEKVFFYVFCISPLHSFLHTHIHIYI